MNTPDRVAIVTGEGTGIGAVAAARIPRRIKVGVVVPTAPRTGSLDLTRSQFSYRQIRDFALRAEAAGVDSLWILDHLLFRIPPRDDGGIWEAWTMMSAIAEATSNVELGSLVLCSPFRNPTLLAKMAVTLDEVSDGRLILGIGAGWHQEEFRAFGYPYSRLVSRFEEAVEIVAPLIRTGQTSFDGSYYSAENARVLPRGPRSKGPPLLIGADGPRMLRLVARFANSYNTSWFGYPDGRLAERLANLRAACREIDRDPSTLEVTVGITVDATRQGTGGATARLQPAASFVELMHKYETLGVGHLICALSPSDTPGLTRLAQALRAYDRGTV